MNTPMLSVCLITYNHENYIRQAIEGVLMQLVDFDWELIIADDCSTDRTREIILEYKNKHPNFIKLILQKKNVGPARNWLDLIDAPKSKYIAYFEGDDYWIDPLKLKKQIDILESNHNIGLVYTNVKYFNQTSGDLIEISPKYVKKRSEVIPLLLKSKFIESATTVFRRDILNKVIDTIKIELETAIIGDTRIFLETAYISEIYFLEDITTVYRILDGSASHPKDINQYISALKDSYLCRKTFVHRNKLNSIWLSDAICNTNRGLINQAFVSKKYLDTIKLLNSILILDTFKYCSLTVFLNKINIYILIKFVLSLSGIGFLRQKLK